MKVTILYKITDSKGQTSGQTQWGGNVTHKTKGRGRKLCSNEVLHAYRDPYLAVFHNPMGGNYGSEMQMWEAKGRVVVDDGMNVGCKSLTTTKRIDVPAMTTEQRVEIAIRCAVRVYKEPGFIKWTQQWLDGSDRTGEAARAAKAAEAAPWAAAWAAKAAETAAWAATWAAGKDNINLIKIIREVTDV